MTTKFTPVTARGRELRQLILERIEREVERTKADEYATQAGQWDQNSWGTWNARKLANVGIDLDHWREGEPIPPEVAVECGTAFCFAGHATVMVGDWPLLMTQDRPRSVAGMFHVKAFDTEKVMTVGERAAELLELTEEQADALFCSENTLEDIRTVLTRIDNGQEVSRCDDCEQFVWVCDYEGVTCQASGEHLDACTCHECLPDDEEGDE